MDIFLICKKLLINILSYETKFYFTCGLVLIVLIQSCTSDTNETFLTQQNNLELVKSEKERKIVSDFIDLSSEIIYKVKTYYGELHQFELDYENIDFSTNEGVSKFYNDAGVTIVKLTTLGVLIDRVKKETRFLSLRSELEILSFFYPNYETRSQDDCVEYKRLGEELISDFQIEMIGCCLTGACGGPAVFGGCMAL